jgi:hypothetical protein
MHQSKKWRINIRIRWILTFALRQKKPKEIAPSRFGRQKFLIYLPKSVCDLVRHNRNFWHGYPRRRFLVNRIGSSRKNGTSGLGLSGGPTRALTGDMGAARFA